MKSDLRIVALLLTIVVASDVMNAASPVAKALPEGRCSLDEPPRLEPGSKTKPHSANAWTSKGGLRFMWSIPEGYDGKSPRNVVVICHGTGLDYRWGFANHAHRDYRPNDILIAVDGPSPGANGSRLFLGEADDAKAFKSFLDEVRAWFAIDRVFLYGHSQGGFFVIYFAGQFPDAVAGVVAHASGAWNWTKISSDLMKIPIAFMHGSADPVVPYSNSTGSRDAFEEKGFEHLLLRRLPGYNHWPNGVRSSECLDWCEGIATADADRALDCARELLRPKPVDNYGYEMAPAFGAARQVLRRFEDGGKSTLAANTKQKADAKSLADRIDKGGQRHADAVVKAGFDPKKAPALDGKPWIGHLVSMREDWRHVPTFDAFTKSIGLEKLEKDHAKAAAKILEVWYAKAESDPAAVIKIIGTDLGKAWSYEGFPQEMDKKMDEWERDASKLRLTKKDLAAFDTFKNWRKGLADGKAAYTKLCKDIE